MQRLTAHAVQCRKQSKARNVFAMQVSCISRKSKNLVSKNPECSTLQFLHATIAHCFIFFAIFVLSKGTWVPLSTNYGPGGYPWWLPYYVQIPRVSELEGIRDGYLLSIIDVRQVKTPPPPPGI